MSSHTTRTDYQAFIRQVPASHAALLALGEAVDHADLDKRLTELVKLRVSQINGCAFCVQHHLNVARTAGVDAAKLDLVAAWRDAGVFSAQECAALAWAECLTQVSIKGAPDHAYAALCSHFTEAKCVLLTVTIAAINAWNRLGVGLRFAPSVARARA
jgi:AhpD family alkylhydroperoxidase